MKIFGPGNKLNTKTTKIGTKTKPLVKIDFPVPNSFSEFIFYTLQGQITT